MIEPDLVLVIDDWRHTALPGRLLPKLVPLLDGTMSREDVVAAVEGHATAIDVDFGLDMLQAAGVLASAPLDDPPAPSAEIRLAPVDQGVARTVRLVTFGEVEESLQIGTLEEHGVRVATDAQRVLVLTEDYLHPEIEGWHEEAVRGNVSWLLARPVGTECWVGPSFGPRTPGCWPCLARRLRRNRPWLQLEAPRAHVIEAAAPLSTTARSHLRAAHTWVAERAARWLTGTADEPVLTNTLHTLSHVTGEVRRHVVVPASDCPTCSRERATGTEESGGIRTHAATAAATGGGWTDGGYRSVDPQETCARLERHLSPLTGVVSRLERQDAGGSVVYVAEHLFPPLVGRSEGVHRGWRRQSAGKGFSDAQARVSALGEAIERYSGVYRGGDATLRATARELGDDAVPAGDVLQFSARQLADRDRWNSRTRHPYERVPETFDDGRERDWTELRPLGGGPPRYLPTARCFYGHPEADDCPADSNGTAAGNSFEEAVLQGLLELIERDAVAVWWYNRIPRPRIALDGAEMRRMSEHYRSLGRRLAVYDITHDLGIPTFAAVARDATAKEGQPLLGFGAHVDPAIALARALSEINQFLPGLLAGSGRRLVSRPLALECPFLDEPTGVRDRGEFGPPLADDIASAIELCVERLLAAGIETFVLDQSRPEFELDVVRVVAPGLRHYWPRFAPGRLFEVPVAVGWRRTPCSESDLHEAHVLI